MKEYTVVVTHVWSALVLAKEIAELTKQYPGWDLVSVTTIPKDATVIVFGRDKAINE